MELKFFPTTKKAFTELTLLFIQIFRRFSLAHSS